jgi:CBS domain-containing protein
MQRWTVKDVMTRQVVTVHPGTPFKEIAGLLADHAVPAVPVVDAFGRPVGIVSDGDLLRHRALPADADACASALWLTPEDRTRAFAETAQGLMTRPVFTARPAWSTAEAARVLSHHRVRSLPVVDGSGRVVGIVTRSDLLRVYAREDRLIHEEITGRVLRPLGLDPERVAVTVADGVVTLRGELELRSRVTEVLRRCRAVDGVVAVHDQLVWLFDDRDTQVNPGTMHGLLHYRA